MRFSPQFQFIFALVTGLSVGLSQTGYSSALLGSATFPDVRRGTYYDEAVGELSSVGIINGYDDGKFGPNDYVTRGQVAVLMKRLRDQLTGNVNQTQQSADSSESSDSSNSSDSSDSSASSDPSSDSSSSDSSSSSDTITSAGTVRFTIASYAVDEDAGSATVSVIRTSGNRGVVTVEYATSAGTAVEGDDYEEKSGTLQFADGETSRSFTVTIKDDEQQDGNKTINLTLSEPTGGVTVTTPSEAVLTIRDNETSQSGSSSSNNGILGFSAVSYNVLESGGSITITVERTGGTSGEVGVSYATSDGSANSSHYDAESGSFTFADGETEKSFDVSVDDDGGISGNKTINLTLSSVTGGAELGLESSEITIIDDEVASFGTGSLKFTKNTFQGSENDGEAVVNVVRTGGAQGEVSVTYKTTGGTAVAGSDYSAVNDTLTFRNGESEKTFSIVIQDDSLSDPGETITVKLEDPTNGATLGTPATATVEIE